MTADAARNYTPPSCKGEPFFIVGCPRSGTTLLQRMLDAHPSVAVAPETFFIRRFWRRRATYGDIQHDTAFEQLLHDIMAMPEFDEMGLDAEAFAAAAQYVERSYAALFRLVLQQFAEQRGAPRAGEKTPNHVLYLPTLHDFFPEARFIHLVRDPRAVVNSWQSVPWSSGRAWRDAEIWVEYVAAGRAAQPLIGDALLAVHFEDLVRNPNDQLRRVCDHLAIDFDPAMLAFHERTPNAVNIAREPWKENVTQPVDPATADRWRTRLGARAKVEAEAVAAEEMRHWGYAPEVPAWQRSVAQATLPVRRLGWKLELWIDQRGRT